MHLPIIGSGPIACEPDDLIQASLNSDSKVVGFQFSQGSTTSSGLGPATRAQSMVKLAQAGKPPKIKARENMIDGKGELGLSFILLWQAQILGNNKR